MKDSESRSVTFDLSVDVIRPGEHLADYVLVCRDGCEYRLASRHRFEAAKGEG